MAAGDSRIALTNKEIKSIIKIIKSIEYRVISLTEATEKVKSRPGGYLGNILGPLMKVGLSFMINVLTAKNILIPLELTAVV